MAADDGQEETDLVAGEGVSLSTKIIQASKLPNASMVLQWFHEVFPAHLNGSKWTNASATTLSKFHIDIPIQTRNIIKHTEIWRLLAHK